MSPTSPSAAIDAAPHPSAPADVAAAARARAEGRMVMLARLAEIGMGIAEACGQRAQRQPEEGTEGLADASPAHAAPAQADLCLAFARVARAVRLTLALQARLENDLDSLGREAAHQHRLRILRLADRAIEAETDDRREAEALSETVRERLHDDEDWGDLAARPPGETVTLICKDLGLSPDWAAWFGVGDASAPPPPSRHPRVEPPGPAEGRPEDKRRGNPRTQQTNPFNCEIAAAPVELLGPRDYGLRPSPEDDGLGGRADTPHPSAPPTPSPARGEGDLRVRLRSG